MTVRTRRTARTRKMGEVRNPAHANLHDAALLAGWIDDTITHINKTGRYVLPPKMKLRSLTRSLLQGRPIGGNEIIGIAIVIPNIVHATGAQLTMVIGMDGDIGNLFDHDALRYQPYRLQSDLLVNGLLANNPRLKPFHGNIPVLVYKCNRRRVDMDSVLDRVVQVHEHNALFKNVPCTVMVYHRFSKKDCLFLPTTPSDFEKQFTVWREF